MPYFDVEVLVHLNTTLRVQARNYSQAVERAREAAETHYPQAALVDVVDVKDVDG